MAARVVSTCEVCERTAPVRTHPCRFATGCDCWRGVPCQPKAAPKPTKELPR